MGVEFDGWHVSNELLRDWAVKEKRAVRMPAVPGPPLQPAARSKSIVFMRKLAEVCSYDGSAPSSQRAAASWFRAVSIFDVFCINSPKGVPLELLPLYIAAAMRIAAKAEGGDLTPESVRGMIQEWDWTGQKAKISGRALHARERAMEKSLRWHVTFPCLHSWAVVFLARFQNLAEVSETQLVELWQWILFHVWILTYRQPAIANDASPQDLARGLLVLALAHAGIARGEDFGMTGEDWQNVLNTFSLPLQERSVFEQHSRPETCASKLLADATMTDHITLEDNCVSTATLLLAAHMALIPAGEH